MLLSGLLNTAGGQQRDALLAQHLQPPMQQPDQPAALPEAAERIQGGLRDDYSENFSAALPGSPSLPQSSTSGSTSSISSGRGRELPAAGSLPSMEGSITAAAVTAAGASSPPPGSLQHSFADAAEDQDTVLTGSPVAADSLSALCSSRLGDSSPGGSPAAAAALPAGFSSNDAPGRAAAPAAAAGKTGREQQEKQGGDSMRPPREAVKQRLWSFQAIPQRTASIPSRGPAAAAASAAGEAGLAAVHCSASGSARPAFYTRAGPLAPRSPGVAATAALPLPAAPAAAKAAGGSGALSAAQLRQERLEQLSRPRHVTPRWRRQQRGGAAAFSAAASPAPAPAPEQDTPGRHAEPGSTKTAHPSAAPADSGGIAAWRPSQPPLQQQAASGTSSKAAAAAAVGSTAQWPQRLGSELSAAELQRATGAYSEERFQQRMGQLSATLAARQAQRRQVSDATAAGEVCACACGWVQGQLLARKLRKQAYAVLPASIAVRQVMH